jgi:hypothetical protein
MLKIFHPSFCDQPDQQRGRETYWIKRCIFAESGKAEAGNGGDQPARNSLIDRNGEGGCQKAPFPLTNILGEHAFKNASSRFLRRVLL